MSRDLLIHLMDMTALSIIWMFLFALIVIGLTAALRLLGFSFGKGFAQALRRSLRDDDKNAAKLKDGTDGNKEQV